MATLDLWSDNDDAQTCIDETTVKVSNVSAQRKKEVSVVRPFCVVRVGWFCGRNGRAISSL